MIDKTNVQHNVCHCRQPVKLCSYEPAVVASLLKLFLRELPEPVLTSRLAGSWEERLVWTSPSSCCHRLSCAPPSPSPAPPITESRLAGEESPPPAAASAAITLQAQPLQLADKVTDEGDTKI